MDIKEIAERIKNNPSPHELADLHRDLAAEYAFISGQLDDIDKVMNQEWLHLREKSTSDAQADKKWGLTDNGLNERVYKRQLKAIEKLMGSIKVTLEVKGHEARNQY